MTTVTELVTWLRAQVDEDERAAISERELDAYWRDRTDADAVWVSPLSQDGYPADPARVLAEVEAKRQILDGHDPDWPRLECPTCCGYDGNDNYGVERRPREAYPCRVVRLLALPYAGRPGYDESWRP